MKQRRAPTKNELAQQVQGQTKELGTRVEQLEMATRVSQMMAQQIGNSMSQLAADMREIANRQRDIQYRLLAVQEVSGLDVNIINQLAEDKQIGDFTEASDKENVEMGYTAGDVISEDSIVIFTTKTAAEGKGILRSKLSLTDIALPEFREALLAKKAGDVFEADLQGTKHEVTLLEVLVKPEPVVEPSVVKEEIQDGQEQQA
jgi:hypothetical protein